MAPWHSTTMDGYVPLEVGTVGACPAFVMIDLFADDRIFNFIFFQKKKISVAVKKKIKI
jgi:hypothetical protein